jgi:hypothetical protein
MFEKRVDIFKKKDKEAWESVKKALDEGGFKDYKAGHYLQESVMAGGCGAKLDPRDFGGKGRIDREVYFVKVKEKDKDAALAILRANAIVPSVDTESIMTDAALRKHPLL